MICLYVVRSIEDRASIKYPTFQRLSSASSGSGKGMWRRTIGTEYQKKRPWNICRLWNVWFGFSNSSKCMFRHLNFCLWKLEALMQCSGSSIFVRVPWKISVVCVARTRLWVDMLTKTDQDEEILERFISGGEGAQRDLRQFWSTYCPQTGRATQTIRPLEGLAQYFRERLSVCCPTRIPFPQ